MEYLLSVVVPVYNVQDYLRQCLDSIINQSYRNLEIIIVNDGSTDSSYEICKEYALKDDRIVLLSQENKGLSAARNVGIKRASGKYIAFVDSDDWLTLDCYETVMKKMLVDDVDIVSYGIFKFYGDKVDVNLKECMLPVKGPINSFNYLSELFSLWPLVWAKVYKKSFIDCNNIFFAEGLLYEDTPFVIACYIRAAKVSFVDKALHYYRLNRDGQISKSGKRTLDFFGIMEVIKKDLIKEECFSEVYPLLSSWIIGNMYWLFGLTDPFYQKSFYIKMRKFFLDSKKFFDLSSLGDYEKKILKLVLENSFCMYKLKRKFGFIKI